MTNCPCSAPLAYHQIVVWLPTLCRKMDIPYCIIKVGASFCRVVCRVRCALTRELPDWLYQMARFASRSLALRGWHGWHNFDDLLFSQAWLTRSPLVASCSAGQVPPRFRRPQENRNRSLLHRREQGRPERIRQIARIYQGQLQRAIRLGACHLAHVACWL